MSMMAVGKATVGRDYKSEGRLGDVLCPSTTYGVVQAGEVSGGRHAWTTLMGSDEWKFSAGSGIQPRHN